jgi:arylsulfatase A
VKPLLIVLLLTLGGARLAAAAAISAAPNFVFILADDQSWSGTSVPMLPGDERSHSPNFRTPNLERLATEGVTFSQAYAAHCKCESSRAAVQMGRTTTTLNAPDRSARNWSAPVSDSLANTLKRAQPSYRAAHFGKWQWFHPPASMGYDASDGVTTNATGESPDPEDPKLSFSLTRRAQAFMTAQVKEGRPFYLQLSYYAVHTPAQALAATLAKYAASAGPAAKGGRGDRAAVAAMTEDLDACVGEVLRQVDALGIADRTYIIYMSDNGGRAELLHGGKGNLGEGGLRVPLIVRGPGVARGVYRHDPVVGYDVYATVLDLAAPGFPLPRGVEGGSWRNVLTQPAGRVTRAIDRFVFHQAVEIDHPQSAIRKGDFKLIYEWDTRHSYLYHLTRDIGETRNLVGEQPELAAQLQTELKDHVRAGLGIETIAALERGQSTSTQQKKKKKTAK